MKKILHLAILLLTLGLIIVGITSFTNAYYNATLEGNSEIHSALWQVEGQNYQKFGNYLTFSKIKPGDSGIININARLYTEDVPTSVTFNYNIPQGLGELEFYLVDNTSNQAIKIAKLTGTGSIDLDISIFTRSSDLELRWIYPKHASHGVCGILSYSLVFSQIETLTTYYTDVSAGSLGNFSNVEVTVNQVNHTVSFVAVDENGDVVLTITDVTYTNEGTYLSLTPTDDYPDGVQITNPEVMNE